MAKITYKRPPSYLLELDYEEAEALQAVLGCVGGHSTRSRRAILDRISSALEGVNLGYDANDIEGEINFISVTDYSVSGDTTDE